MYANDRSGSRLIYSKSFIGLWCNSIVSFISSNSINSKINEFFMFYANYILVPPPPRWDLGAPRDPSSSHSGDWPFNCHVTMNDAIHEFNFVENSIKTTKFWKIRDRLLSSKMERTGHVIIGVNMADKCAVDRCWPVKLQFVRPWSIPVQRMQLITSPVLDTRVSSFLLFFVWPHWHRQLFTWLELSPFTDWSNLKENFNELTWSVSIKMNENDENLNWRRLLQHVVAISGSLLNEIIEN